MCLDSILKQDERPYEVIVVNNCSTDSTSHILSKYSANKSVVKSLRMK